ncbi:hypothetical protein [Nocardioides dilutus]
MSHRWDLDAAPPTHLVFPVRIDSEGRTGPTRGQARGPGWRFTAPGWVVPADTSNAVEQRILEALTWAGPHAVATGWAALRLHGAGFFDGLARDGRTELPVPIAANGERRRPRPGILLTEDRIPDDEVIVLHGMRCAIVDRALFDEIRRQPDDWDGVVAVDMTCGAQLTSIRRMQKYRWARYWYRDVRRLDRILPLAHEGARSRPEVDLRRIWTERASWPEPLCNRTILDLETGALVGMPDLFDPRRSVAGEYAGGGHREADQHDGDLDRAMAFRRVGIEAVEVTARHLRDPQRVVRLMEEAEERAALLRQRWKLGPAPPSLDAILDLRDGRRLGRRDTPNG